MHLRIRHIGVVLAAGLLLGAGQQPADVLIRGGTIYTGAEETPFVGDVAVRGDRIVYVGRPTKAFRARRVVEAKGLVVAPGFIDPHTHPETYINARDPAARLNAPWLTQGVSTIFVGIDGWGDPEVKGVLARVEAERVGVNIAAYVPFGGVRERVLGKDARAPSVAELERMKALVREGMCDGALGLSAGLFYAPQSFAKTEEVIAVAREAAVRGGVYDTHQRDESSYSIGLMASVDEAIRIGAEAGMPVHFAHLKALGVDLQGEAPAVIKRIEDARASGQDVTADQYPWLASGTTLDAALVPRWALDGGLDALVRRLDDPADLARIRGEMADNLRRRGGAESLLMTSVGAPWAGRRLSELAHAWSLDPRDAALRMIREAPTRVAVASFNMVDADVDLIMRRPWVVTASDGSDGHPRQYATFPQKYAVYVRERKVITLGQFIRQSAGRTADMFKLDRRGYLRPGHFADVVVFDPAGYAPKADYLRPQELSVGVRELLVNGTAAISDSRLTGAAAGRALRHRPARGCPA